MKLEDMGFATFEDLLDALTPTPKRTPPTAAQRARYRHRKKIRARKKRREKRRAARKAREARWADPVGLARMAPALAKIATGEPGRWLDVLRQMAPGEAYAAHDVARARGMACNALDVAFKRDLLARGFVERKPCRLAMQGWAIGRTRAGYVFSITDLGLQMARGELPLPKRGAPKGKRKNKGAAEGDPV